MSTDTNVNICTLISAEAEYLYSLAFHAPTLNEDMSYALVYVKTSNQSKYVYSITKKNIKE